MQLTILGSGTTLPSSKRAAPGYWLEVEGSRYLLDSGEGTKRRIAEAGLKFFSLDGIFYTHTHVDHVSELPAILWALCWHEEPRSRPLTIVGPEGFKNFYGKMLDAFWPQFKKKETFPVDVQEMKKDRYTAGPLDISTRPLDKQSNTPIKHSVGYRFTYQDRSLVYTGDVGYNKDVITLADKADTLLIESAVAAETKSHLTPRQAGTLAHKAGVKRLVLTHFYPAVERIDIAAEAAKEFKGEILLAEDLLTITL